MSIEKSNTWSNHTNFKYDTPSKPSYTVTPDPFTILNPFLDSWTIGFDRHFRLLEDLKKASKSTYPPYNIRQLKNDKYEVEIAVAGFTKRDLDITVKENTLTVTGDKESDTGDYLHKGIATRNFTQTFALADDVKVTGAEINDGLLVISLEREIPEHKKPKTIEIK